MGFRFRKSFGKGPFRVTVSKSGVGYSVGTKGFRYTKKAGGGTRTTASIPGTGISYVNETSARKSTPSAAVPSRIQPEAYQSAQTGSASNFSGSRIASGSNTVLRSQKFCGHCKREIDVNATRCPYCGRRWGTSGFDINPVWGIATLIIGLALMESKPLPAVVFLIATVCLAVKGMKNKKKAENRTVSSAPPAAPIPEIQSNTPAQDEKADAVDPYPHEDASNEPGQEAHGSSCAQPERSTPIVSEPNTGSVVAKSHRVAGMSHYMDNILELAVENSDYDMSKKEIVDCGMEDEKIWKYEFYPSKTELVPEPDNPHDPNAIKVIVDGEHVGYIKEKSCAHLLKVISEDRIRGIDCEIGGGPYKTVYEEMDDDTYKNVYKVEHGETNIFVHLTVYEEK